MGEPVIVVDPLGRAGLIDAIRPRPHLDWVAAWLAGYRSKATRENYSAGIKRWLTFLDTFGIDPLAATRAHVELFLRHLEGEGHQPRTVANRLTVVSSWYRWLVEEELLDRSPTIRVKRPKIPRKSPTGFLRRPQLADLVAASKVLGPNQHAAISILVFNGLRVGELCSLDVDGVLRRGHYLTLGFIRKGGEVGDAVLARSTEHAVLAVIGDRTEGPLLRTRLGTRIDQQWVQRVLERCRPAIANCPTRLHPHMLRHSWTTLALADGVALDQVVHDGGWSDARMATTVYAHAQEDPIRAASHRIESAVLSL